MSNGHLIDYFAKEKEISKEEARKLLKVRRDFNHLNSDFVNLLKKNKEVFRNGK
jgi:riboflavin synthase